MFETCRPHTNDRQTASSERDPLVAEHSRTSAGNILEQKIPRYSAASAMAAAPHDRRGERARLQPLPGCESLRRCATCPYAQVDCE